MPINNHAFPWGIYIGDLIDSPNSSSSKFNAIEKTALHRHHHLLSFNAPTLSEYNQQGSFREKYYLLLVNLDDFPDNIISHKRIKKFFDSAYEAGFYTIAFGSTELLRSESKSLQSILNKFSHLNIENQKITLSEELKDITTYNTLYPQSPIYRIILVIDEVHRLFSGDYKQKRRKNARDRKNKT